MKTNLFLFVNKNCYMRVSRKKTRSITQLFVHADKLVILLLAKTLVSDMVYIPAGCDFEKR